MDALPAFGGKVCFLNVPLSLAKAGVDMVYFLSGKRCDYREKLDRLTEDRAYPHDEIFHDLGYQPGRFEDRAAPLIARVMAEQGLWPEAFQMVMNIPVISPLAFSPFRVTANRIYGAADAVCAVSRTRVERALSVNRKGAKGTCVFLGTKLETFDANGRRCTEERFDRNNSYQALVDAVIGPTVVKE